MSTTHQLDNASAHPERSRLRLLAGEWLALVLVPLLLLALPLPPTKGKWAIHKQDWVLIGSLLIAAASGVLYFVRTPLFRPRSIWPLIVLGTALLVAGSVIWNKQFRKYAAAHPEYRREDFRKAMVTTLHWPVYGRYDNAIARYDPATKRYDFSTLPYVALSSVLAAGWVVWAIRRRADQRWGVGSFAILIGFQIALTLAFAMCEPGGRWAINVSGYSEFAKDLHRFKGVLNTLQHYVERMPTLEWYGQHYPPGNLILMKIEAALGLPGLTKTIAILATALAAIPLYLLAKEAELSEQAASAAVLIFSASTSVLILSTINTTSLLVLPGTICLWTLVRALRKVSIPSAAVLGLAFFGYLCFSFSASILGVLMALITLLAMWRASVPLRNVIVTAVVAGLVLLGVIGLTYASTRFNLIACFIAAVRGHHEQQGNGGFDDRTRYLLRSTGNVLAYLLSVVPICILAASSLRAEKRGMRWVISTAVLVTIALAGFSGLFYLETERIWIFLTPALALAAGFETARQDELTSNRFTAALLLLVILISCSQEFLFMHYR